MRHFEASLIFSLTCFNPRTPCGVRRFPRISLTASNLFQSTHSLRSATRLRGGGPPGCRVSIHALLAECDDWGQCSVRPDECFNPRTPCGVRLFGFYFGGTKKVVSIHALLAECDLYRETVDLILRSFNPRTPCGVRHKAIATANSKKEFQSTHSLRSATFRGAY